MNVLYNLNPCCHEGWKENMTSLDMDLQNLARKAQNQPFKSPQRQLALHKLVKKIQEAPSLVHRPRSNSSFESIYEDIFNEALQETLIEVCKNIDKYDPEKGKVMAWVNSILKNRFKDVFKRHSKHGITYVPRSSIGILVKSLDELDTFIAEKLTTDKKESFEHELIKKYLIENNLFRSINMRNKPEVTWQDIAIKFIIEDKSWKTISIELGGISEHTIRSFYSRGFDKFKLDFQQYLDEGQY